MPTQSVTRLVSRWYTYRIIDTYWNGSVTDTGLVNYYLYSNNRIYARDKTWVRTPNFRTLVAQKKHLPDNAFSWVESKKKDDYIVLTRTTTYPYAGPTSLKQRVIIDNVPTAWMEEDGASRTLSEDAVRAKLVSKAKGAEWNAPVFFGEARETIKMISTTIRSVASSYHELRRGNLIGALANLGIQGTSSQRRRYNREFGVNPTRAAANWWLSMKYGWIPAYNDIYNAATTLASLSLGEKSREGEVHASVQKTDTRITPNYYLQVSPAMTSRKTQVVKESTKGVWRFKPTSWNSWGALGLTNPALVAWELMPLSFVVDWVLPVGRYLEGLDVDTRFDHLGGSIGYRREVRNIYDNVIYVGYPAAGSHAFDKVIVERTALTSSPTVGVSSIWFDPQLGASRVTSAIALLAQAFTGRR